MSKFRKPTGDQDNKRPRRSFKPGVNTAKGKKSEEDEKKGRKGYKAKRSFTKNKSYREINTKDGLDKPQSRFERNEKSLPFKRKFSKPGTDKKVNKDEKPKPFDKENKFSDSKVKRIKRSDSEVSAQTKRTNYRDFEDGKVFTQYPKEKSAPVSKNSGPKKNDDGLIRLNKYLSNAGIASRRDADNLIIGGTVKVNGEVITQLGYKINPGDKVTYGDASVKSERKMYLLLNKPKDYISTVDDPQERKTVMELIKGACKERLYPVGRLDRNTTGLLLFTNDGDLTTKLTHPKFGVKKVYHVSLNKGLKPDDFTAIVEGLELEDGIVKADDLAFVGEGKKEIGIEIHSGKNRVVRRIFEQLGYDVLKLDRVVFAGLTKKDLPRGKHRFLTAKEISFLKMVG
ncbi:MAG: pseudouridine synthase [Bacteroidota bacterium]